MLHIAEFLQAQQEFLAARARAQVHVQALGAQRAVITPARAHVLRHRQHEQLVAVKVVKAHAGEVLVALAVVNGAAGVQPRRQLALLRLDALRPGAQRAKERIAGHGMRVHVHLDIQRPLRQHLLEHPELEAALSDFHARVIDDGKAVLPERPAHASDRMIDSHSLKDTLHSIGYCAVLGASGFCAYSNSLL